MSNRSEINQAARPAHLRQVNLQSAIRQMRQMSVFSKIDLARELGISTTTMTKLFAQLEADRFIERSPEIDKSFGRPKILYRLSPTPQVAAVVIDIDTTTLCVSSLQGDILPEHQISFPTGRDPAALFPIIGKKFSKVWKKSGGEQCRMIGVCIQGLIESKSGQSMFNPNLHWLEGTRPAEEISRRLGIPSVVLHEAKALSRAQLRTPDNTDETVTLDFSSGVGMSVISKGQYLAGQSGFAGEIGHIIMNPGGTLCGCGNHGCLETVAADRVFFQTLEKKGKAVATKKIIEWQATGIATAINLFNPQTVYIHSAMFQEIPDYLQQIRKRVEQKAMAPSSAACRLLPTDSGKLKGTLLAAIDRALSKTIAAA